MFSSTSWQAVVWLGYDLAEASSVYIHISIIVLQLPFYISSVNFKRQTLLKRCHVFTKCILLAAGMIGQYSRRGDLP